VRIELISGGEFDMMRSMLISNKITTCKQDHHKISTFNSLNHTNLWSNTTIINCRKIIGQQCLQKRSMASQHKTSNNNNMEYHNNRLTHKSIKFIDKNLIFWISANRQTFNNTFNQEHSHGEARGLLHFQKFMLPPKIILPRRD